MKDFIVKDSTGTRIRHGTCRDEDLELQARPGETVLEATPADMAAADEAYREHRAARVPAEVAPDPVDVVLEVLRAKGLAVSDAELAAARDNLVRAKDNRGKP